MRTLIFPDIHGRSFWRKPIEEHFDKVDHVVFLGDYLDPYSHEGVTKQTALDVFKELLALKNENQDKITMLLGNHDLSYVYDRFTPCRHDDKNHKEIHKLFKDNAPFFRLAYDEKRGNMTYLYTHAGLMVSFFRRHEDIIAAPDAASLNRLLELDDDTAVSVLDEIGMLRGGIDPTGSFVWSDVRERFYEKNEFKNIFQIFGHTMLTKDMVKEENFACIDSQRGFILDNENNLSPLEP